VGNIEFGPAFSRVFDLYGKYAAPLLIWAAVFQGIMAVVVAVLFASILAGGAGAIALSGLAAFAIGLIATALMTGAYIVGLDEASRTGSFPSFGEVWPRVTPKIGALIITSLLAGLGVVLGLVMLLVPGLILLTWWAVIAPVVMLEGRSGTSALGRSRELVSGNGWTVFGLIVATSLITVIGGNVIGRIVGGIFGGRETVVGSFAGEWVSGTLLAPISALLAIVIYEALVGRDGPGPEIADPTEPSTQQPREGDNSGPFI
jgi:hypothetical protein